MKQESSNYLIDLSNISVSFGDREPILDGIDFRIEKGEFIYLTGISGAGKSTILKLINGLALPNKGSVKVNNHAISGSSIRSSKMRGKVGYMPQNCLLLENRSVRDNIGLPMLILSSGKKRTDESIRRVAETCRIEHLLDRICSTLSGGEKQMVTLARAIVTKPSIILADEPTANLDFNTATRLCETLFALNKTGITIVFSTHETEIIKAFPARIFIIKNRKINEFIPGKPLNSNKKEKYRGEDLSPKDMEDRKAAEVKPDTDKQPEVIEVKSQEFKKSSTIVSEEKNTDLSADQRIKNSEIDAQNVDQTLNIENSGVKGFSTEQSQVEADVDFEDESEKSDNILIAGSGSDPDEGDSWIDENKVSELEIAEAIDLVDSEDDDEEEDEEEGKKRGFWGRLFRKTA